MLNFQSIKVPGQKLMAVLREQGVISRLLPNCQLTHISDRFALITRPVERKVMDPGESNSENMREIRMITKDFRPVFARKAA